MEVSSRPVQPWQAQNADPLSIEILGEVGLTWSWGSSLTVYTLAGAILQSGRGGTASGIILSELLLGMVYQLTEKFKIHLLANERQNLYGENQKDKNIQMEVRMLLSKN